MSESTLLWLRNDLRLADNPALRKALSLGHPVVPVFIWSPDEESPWSRGEASRWWLHRSLLSLEADLGKRGSRLVAKDAPLPPAGAPRRISAPHRWPVSLDVSHLGLEPTLDWTGGLEKTWTPGETEARKALRRSLIISCTISPRLLEGPSGHSSPGSPGAGTARVCGPGKRDARVIPSSMPGCVNSGRPAGCTTGSG